MTDRERILLLLDAVPDFTFEPETATGKMLRRSTLRGPAPHHKGPCQTCAGVGRCEVKFDQQRPCPIHRLQMSNPERKTPFPAHDCVRCEACKGSGRVDYDGYTNKPVTTTDSSPEARTDADVRERKARDRARIDALLGAADDPPLDVDAFTAYVDRMGAPAMGSIPQVIRLLDELRLRNHLVYRMVVSVHVLHLRHEDELGRALTLRLDNGMRFLQRSLTRPLRVPRELVERQRLRAQRRPAHPMSYAHGKGDRQLPFRDREIRRLRAQGESVAALAAAFRLSTRQVQRVLGDGNGERAA